MPMSDLNGTDIYAHGGTPAGLSRQVLSAFVRYGTKTNQRCGR